MYLSNVGTQNMIKKCRSLHKSVIWGRTSGKAINSCFLNLGNCVVYPPVQAETANTTHPKLNWVHPSHSEQNVVKKTELASSHSDLTTAGHHIYT
jgi:hypothetical protein